MNECDIYQESLHAAMGITGQDEKAGSTLSLADCIAESILEFEQKKGQLRSWPNNHKTEGVD